MCDSGKLVFIDVDLPEIEDLPNKIASAPQRGYKLSVKETSAGQSQRLHMKHIHGIGFRIIVEALRLYLMLNKSSVCLLAASESCHGQVGDEYL